MLTNAGSFLSFFFFFFPRSCEIRTKKRELSYQRTLKPLGRVCIQSILGKVPEMSGKRAKTFRPHRITLVGLSKGKKKNIMSVNCTRINQQPNLPLHYFQSDPSQKAPQVPSTWPDDEYQCQYVHKLIRKIPRHWRHQHRSFESMSD